MVKRRGPAKGKRQLTPRQPKDWIAEKFRGLGFKLSNEYYATSGRRKKSDAA